MKKINHWKKAALLVVTAGMLAGSVIPALAYVPSGTEEQLLVEENMTDTAGGAQAETGQTGKEQNADTLAAQEESTSDATKAVIEQNETGTAFSVPGNASLQDSITDGSSKEFYTIRTANNNTFYLVIDKSATSNNVYMLSAVDEADLTEFLSDEELQALKENSEKGKNEVVLPETTKDTTEGFDLSAVPEVNTKTEPTKASSAKKVMTMILLLALGGVGAYYYFKIYKPGKNQEDPGQNQGMEQENFKDDEEDFEKE